MNVPNILSESVNLSRAKKEILNSPIYKNLIKDIINHTSFKMRLWNEVATLFLFAIVFLVVLKSEIDALIGLVGFIGLAIFLMVGIKIYKRYR